MSNLSLPPNKYPCRKKYQYQRKETTSETEFNMSLARQADIDEDQKL